MFNSSPPSQERSLLKWITFGVASTLLLVLIGLVIYAGIVNQNRPPVLTVEIIQPFRAVEDQFYVPFTVENQGGETAEAIQIVAELRVNGEMDEMGEQQVGSLSGGEKVQGSFVFSHDPSGGDLVLRVASYREPQAKVKIKAESTLPVPSNPMGAPAPTEQPQGAKALDDSERG